MTTVIYGISNCDTIKKARKWLSDNNIDADFHDYRKQGLDADWLQAAIETLGWENLLNKRGTTYRQLTDEQKDNLDAASAKALLLEYPAMIKRPLLVHEDKMYLGFNAATYAEIFA